MASKQKKSPKVQASKAVAAKKKAAPAQKPTKPVAKKAAPAPVKKVAPKKTVPAKKTAPVKAKPAAKPVVAKKVAASKFSEDRPLPVIGLKPSPFVTKQRERLLALKDTLLDSMTGVAKDNLRSRAEGSEASAFGMHQADAGSDAYDRDFALSLLSQEQDSLYEIDQALKRIETGSYGMCEMSGKPIPHPRLEALPFTRYTVECQSELEKRNRFQRVRQPVTSLFGLADEDGGDGDDEDSSSDSKE